MSNPTKESAEVFVKDREDKDDTHANTSSHEQSSQVAALDAHDATLTKRDASLISKEDDSEANRVHHTTSTHQHIAPTSSSPHVHHHAESNTSTRQQERSVSERSRDAKVSGSSSLMPTSSVPASLSPSASASASGALIPGSPADNKLASEVAKLKEVVEQSSAEAAQIVLREHWRKFLFGPSNDEHLSFLLRAGFKNASLKVVERVCKEEGIFKEALLTTASKKQAVISRVLKNASAQQLSDLISQDVLDQVFAQRLKSVPAKQLIKMLAEGDRLGYSLDDIINEEDESVMPNLPSRTQSQEGDVEMLDTPEPEVANPKTSVVVTPTYRDPLLIEQERNRQAQIQAQVQAQIQAREQPATLEHPLLCFRCHNSFPSFSGYNYHIAKKVCVKAPPDGGFKWYCPNCIQGFTTKQGMNYHQMKGVCRGQEWVNNTLPSSQPQPPGLPPPPPPPPPPPQTTSARTSPGTQLQLEAAATSIPYQQPTLPPPPPRPAFTSRPRDSEPAMVPSYPQHSVDPGPSTIPRPPLYTPRNLAQLATPLSRASVSVGVSDSDIRQSPSELSPERKMELDRQLDEAEHKYQQQIADIPSSFSPTERANRLVSLKNGNASRKSQIRKSFGVSLRLREKDKAAMKASIKRPKQSFEQYRAAPLSHHPQMSTPTPVYTIPPGPTTGFSPINSGNVARAPPPSLLNSSLAKKSASHSPVNSNSLFAHGSNPNPNKRRRISDDGNSSQFSSTRIVPSQLLPDPQLASSHSPLLSSIQASVLNPAVAAAAPQRHALKKIHVGQAQAKWEALQPRSNANGQMSGRGSEVVNVNGSGPISISSSESSPIPSEAPQPPTIENGAKTTEDDKVRQSVENHEANPTHHIPASNSRPQG
ncbi:hypothetical protein B7494_g5600 [Chlorociboria aeruginascens]|nr:hypothetical protein B7494_g5600 [Chlorociboria aeruginascens]